LPLSIDIGVCYSRAAFISEGSIEMVKDPLYGTPSFASSIYVNRQNHILFGEAADEQFAKELDPDRYQKGFKLFLGSRDRQTYLLQMSPEELLSRMIQNLKIEAERMASHRSASAFIAVPTQYDKNKRNLVQSAAREAGFNRVELFEEPIAVTIYHAWSTGVPSLVEGEIALVYNLGGTFDAALVRQERSGYKSFILKSKPEHSGGREFDRLMYEDLKNYCDPFLRNLLDLNNRSTEALRARFRVRKDLRHLKHVLSKGAEASILIEDGLPAASAVNYSLTQARFNSMIAPKVQQTIQFCDQLVHRANVRWERISRVILVGGSCRIPYVSEEWTRLPGRRVVRAENLDVAVCQGVAIYGNKRQAHIPELVDIVTPLVKSIKGIINLFLDDYSLAYPVMTYAQAIEYFVVARPDDERVVKGAMLRLPHPQGQTFVQVFLDRNNEVVYKNKKPYGRRLLVREFDTELREVFGNKELVLVE
jgi:molecular chaperone DnaK (HSP70)